MKCSCKQGNRNSGWVNDEEVRIKEVAPPTDRVIMGQGIMAGSGTSDPSH